MCSLSASYFRSSSMASPSSVCSLPAFHARTQPSRYSSPPETYIYYTCFPADHIGTKCTVSSASSRAKNVCMFKRAFPRLVYYGTRAPLAVGKHPTYRPPAENRAIDTTATTFSKFLWVLSPHTTVTSLCFSSITYVG